MAVLATVSFIAFSCEKPEDEPNKDKDNTEQEGEGGGEQQGALKADFTFEKDELTVKFTNASTGATMYQWEFGDGITSDEESPEHTYTAGGTFTVKLTAANDDGETSVKEETITVAGAVEAYFTYTAQTDLAGEYGKLIHFDATASTNAASIVWDFGDGTVTEAGTDFITSHKYAEFDTYKVTATVTGIAGDVDVYEFDLEVAMFAELLKGGSMEADDAQYWTVKSGDTTEGYATVEGKPSFVHTFGYNVAGPAGMEGGCLKVSGDNQVEDGSWNYDFYQAIDLTEGDVLSISGDVRWDANTIDNGVLFLCLAPDLESFGTDATAILQLANWWSVVEATETTPKTSTPLPAYSGDFSGVDAGGNNLTSDNSGFSGDGSATLTWTCPATGTYYFGVHCTAVWGLVYGPTAAYYFDNFSIMLKQ